MGGDQTSEVGRLGRACGPIKDFGLSYEQQHTTTNSVLPPQHLLQEPLLNSYNMELEFLSIYSHIWLPGRFSMRGFELSAQTTSKALICAPKSVFKKKRKERISMGKVAFQRFR